MTRRIILNLADDTTATECGACRWSFTPPSPGGRDRRRHCCVFGFLDGARSPECLAAERAAANLVEIAPEDAARIDCCVPFTISADDEDAVTRVMDALKAHGQKARGDGE